MFDSSAIVGYALPKFTQLTVTSYYAASSGSHYGVSLLTRHIEEANATQTRQERLGWFLAGAHIKKSALSNFVSNDTFVVIHAWSRRWWTLFFSCLTLYFYLFFIKYCLALVEIHVRIKMMITLSRWFYKL